MMVSRIAPVRRMVRPLHVVHVNIGYILLQFPCRLLQLIVTFAVRHSIVDVLYPVVQCQQFVVMLVQRSSVHAFILQSCFDLRMLALIAIAVHVRMMIVTERAAVLPAR